MGQVQPESKQNTEAPLTVALDYWTSAESRETYQLAEFESVKHLKITTNFKTIKLGNVLPEPVNSS